MSSLTNERSNIDHLRINTWLRRVCWRSTRKAGRRVYFTSARWTNSSLISSQSLERTRPNVFVSSTSNVPDKWKFELRMAKFNSDQKPREENFVNRSTRSSRKPTRENTPKVREYTLTMGKRRDSVRSFFFVSEDLKSREWLLYLTEKTKRKVSHDQTE